MSLGKDSLAFGVPKQHFQTENVEEFESMSSGQEASPTYHKNIVRLVGQLNTMCEVGYGYIRQETINQATDYAIHLGLREKEHHLTDKWHYKFHGAGSN